MAKKKDRERPLGIDWTPQTWRLADLVPYQKNPRAPSLEGMKDLDKSLTRLGMMQPLTIDTSGEIVSGHRRYEKLLEMGVTEVVCMVPERPLTDEEFREACTRLNHTKAGEWVAELLAELGSDSELKDWGFDEKELKELGVSSNRTRQDDNALATGEEEHDDAQPLAVRGDIYEFKTASGTHRLMCGDSTDHEQVSQLLMGRKWDIMPTDPPYGDAYTDKNARLNELDGGNRLESGIANDAITDYPAFFRGFLEAAAPHAADYNTVYLFMSDGELHTLRLAFEAAGYTFSCYRQWVKDHFVLTRSDYNAQSEHILYGWKGRHRFYGDATCKTLIDFEQDPGQLSHEQLVEELRLIRQHLSNVVRYPRPSRSDIHPTMKPVGLIVKLLNEGADFVATVYDPFSGSGTCFLASEKTGRVACGMELMETNVDRSIRRFAGWLQENGIEFVFRHVNGERRLAHFGVLPPAEEGEADGESGSTDEVF